MDLVDEVQAIAARIPKQIEHLLTEESTKTALVMPFINALGYNVFDPTEVVPEFNADINPRKAEKVDYAIMKDGKPIILIECKAANSNLDDVHPYQLIRYFNVTEARIGILTNGVVYRFHSDLDEPNKMDPKSFLEFNVLEVDGALVEELKRFTKSAFDLDSTLEAASELKYSKEIKRILSQQLREPSEDFVKFFASQIYSGRITQAVRQRFTQITKQALNQFITDRVYDRLKSAMSTEGESASEGGVVAPEVAGPEGSAPDQGDPEIITTEEEIQALYIVKAILHDVVDVKRVVMRDVRTYCGILLDDNNRKSICRLRFNGAQRYLGLLDEQRQEERVPLEHVDDIYKYDDRLKAIVGFYEQSVSDQKAEQEN